MRKIPAIFILLILITAIFPCCEVENCPPNALSFAHFALVDQHGRSIKIKTPLTVIGQITTDITVREEQEDGTIKETIVKDAIVNDTLINQEKEASSIKIPLSFKQSTKIILSYDDGATTDEIDIKHNNIPYFYNIDCGTMMFHEVTELHASSRVLDSITITNPNIDNNEKENFKIYFTLPDNE